MAETVLRVDKLGKRFRLGGTRSHDLLSERFMAAVGGLGRRLANFGRGDGGPDPQDFWALRDVSFEVRRGDTVGVIGRNGAGKSTLLKILSRITYPTEGSAEIRGRIGALLEVGTGFHPELTGRENIYLNGAILGMGKAEIRRKFDEIVAFAEVEKHIDTAVKHYSSGMGLRLGFAVAAHLEHEILVVDEVLAVGDLSFQRKCLGKMQDVSEEGRTVLFVSHNMSAITSLCSRGVLLEAGKVVKEGTSKEVVATYLAGALGASGSVDWTDRQQPGSEGFKLRSVQILGEDSKPVSVVNIEHPLRVRIEYQTERPSMRFRVAASFTTAGVSAFTSLQPSERLHEQPGIYVAMVTVPGNLLAEGEYSVGVSVFASRGSKAHMCLVKSVVAFQVYDPVTGTSARGDFGERYAGVLRPLLPWQTEQIDAVRR